MADKADIQAKLWPAAFERQAGTEGWGLFVMWDEDEQQDVLEIEYIVDPEACREAGLDYVPLDHPWTSDDEVIAYCIVMAVFGGSEMHAQALRIDWDSHGARYAETTQAGMYPKDRPAFASMQKVG